MKREGGGVLVVVLNLQGGTVPLYSLCFVLVVVVGTLNLKAGDCVLVEKG